MTRFFSSLILALTLFPLSLTWGSESLKPFILAYKTADDTATAAAAVREKLTAAGLEIVGSYSPYETAVVIGVTNAALKQTAAKTAFGGYGAVQRVTVTKVNGETQVAYTNPVYMAHAYRLADDLKNVADQLAAALGRRLEYGPEEGLVAKKLRDYQYMFGMEQFEDQSVLADYPDYERAIAAVEAGLAEGKGGVSQVYRVDIPGKKQTLFGVAMKAPTDSDKAMDDGYIMSEIDFKPVRSTGHLPYEILVSDDKVYALYARFRIAINFPDLSMMGSHSFMNIMEAPKAIEQALTRASGGRVERDSFF